MLRKGTPVQDVSQILGHSNISVTETYFAGRYWTYAVMFAEFEGLLWNNLLSQASLRQ